LGDDLRRGVAPSKEIVPFDEEELTEEILQKGEGHHGKMTT